LMLSESGLLGERGAQDKADRNNTPWSA
jgi:hypothetical protein